MVKTHIYLDNELYSQRRMEHLPRVGDEMRLDVDKYATVETIVWCMDESWEKGQRVNIGLTTIADKPTGS